MKINKYDKNGFLKFESHEGTLTEATKSRIWRQILRGDNIAIISACVEANQIDEDQLDEYGNVDNAGRMWDLKSDIRELGKGFTELVSRWSNGPGKKPVDERALFIANISYDDAMSLAQKYNQWAFIYCDSNGCREICSTEHDGFNVGDVILEFDIDNPREILNIDTAKDIFSNKLAGAVSKTVKGSIPFHLKTKDLESTIKESLEIYLVTQPKPSMFVESFGNQRLL